MIANETPRRRVLVAVEPCMTTDELYAKAASVLSRNKAEGTAIISLDVTMADDRNAIVMWELTYSVDDERDLDWGDTENAGWHRSSSAS